MRLSDCCILVSSFDKYEACWEPYWHGLEKYWPSHPQVYFITNFLQAPGGITSNSHFRQDIGDPNRG